MNDVLSMAMDDADSKPKNASDEDKARVSQMAEKVLELEAEIASLEETTSTKKAELNKLQEHELPEAMDKIGMSEFKLLDGRKVSVKPFYTGTVNKDNEDDAFRWLVDKGHEGIIKVEVAVKFGKGEYEVAQDFARYARGFNGATIEAEVARSVHYQTMRGFVREMHEDGGEPLPKDYFNIFVGRKATVASLKKKK